MKEFIESPEALLEQYESDEKSGLVETAVATNRAKYGENQLTKQKSVSVFRRIFDSASEPMSILLIVAGIIALAVNIFRAATGGEADFLECVGVFVAIGLSIGISVVMEGRSAKAFEALSRISENTVVRVIRNGETMLLGQKELVVGDILLLATGDKIPCDGRLLEAMELSADESALTGESMPAKKDAALVIVDEKTPLAERANMVYSGNYITGGFCKVLVTAVGNNTEFGKIAKELTKTDKSSTPLQEKLGRMGKMVTIFGVAAAAIVFIAQLVSFAINGGLNADNILDAFVTSIVLIVAAVPEGLPTIVAVALSLSIIKLSKQNALVKKMIASETVGCINVICSDKTGTLTENKMTVIGYYDTEWHTDATKMNSDYFASNICQNTTADINECGKFIGNPTECALLNFYQRSAVFARTGKTYRDERLDQEIVHVFPFSSELKHMTTVTIENNETVCFVKGSPESVLPMCAIRSEELARIHAAIEKAQSQAMRVIAFGHKVIKSTDGIEEAKGHAKMESGMVFDGFTAIADPLRADVFDAVNQCRSAGIDLKILTGDNIITATAIATELGVLTEGKRAFETKDLVDLSDEELTALLPEIAVIARSTPTIKMRVVQLLKAQGNVVAVTGDGINDAPALKNADVGIAMGISGTEVSKEASDIVLLDDSFSTIARAVRWGRGIYENFKRFIQFQLTVNVSSVVVVLLSVLIGLKAPFTAVQLLWLNIIMDGPPALTLGLEPNHADLMKRPPTSRSENVLTKPMLLRIGLTAVYVSVIFLLQYTLNFLGTASEEEMITVLFAVFSFSHLLNTFNCRELGTVSIFKNMLKNKPMLIVTAVTFVLQLVMIQFAGAFLGTTGLEVIMWLKVLGLALSILAVSELVKLCIRIFTKKGKQKRTIE